MIFSVNRTLGIVFILTLIILGAVFVGIKIGALKPSVQPQQPASPDTTSIQSGWQTFENSTYNISFKYPPSWSINPSSQVFENGDLVAVQFIGQTQKQNTELYDGARFIVMVPQQTSLDLNSWVNNRHGSNVSGTPPQISSRVINGVSLTKVYECGLGCFTYYYTVVRGQVYGVMVSAAGPQQVELDATIEEILQTLVFPN